MRKPFEDLWEVMEARRQQLEVGDVPPIYRPEHLRQSAQRARGCPDMEALCGWLDGQLRRRHLRRWLTIWRHVRLHGCRECQQEVAMIAAVVRPTREARSSDQQWSGGRERASKRSISSSVPVKGPLAWVSGVSVVAVGLSLWLFSQHMGKEPPQQLSEQARSSQAAGPIIWGD
jgi:hypothetical protein